MSSRPPPCPGGRSLRCHLSLPERRRRTSGFPEHRRTDEGDQAPQRREDPAAARKRAWRKAEPRGDHRRHPCTRYEPAIEVPHVTSPSDPETEDERCDRRCATRDDEHENLDAVASAKFPGPALREPSRPARFRVRRHVVRCHGAPAPVTWPIECGFTIRRCRRRCLFVTAHADGASHAIELFVRAAPECLVSHSRLAKAGAFSRHATIHPTTV